MYVDDANTATSRAYTVVNLRLGATRAFGRPWIAPMVGVQNLFNAHYVGSVAINATAGKYYEPAPGRTVFAGLTLATGS